MKSKISDVALDLGVFALDSEMEDSAMTSMYALNDQDWNCSAMWDRVDAKCFAVAS